MSIEVALVISIVSVAFSIFFGIKNNQRSDTHEIENRVKEQTKTDMKLDEISRNVVDIKYDISATKKEVQMLSERLIKVESSAKQAHKRLDRLDGGEQDSND